MVEEMLDEEELDGVENPEVVEDDATTAVTEASKAAEGEADDATMPSLAALRSAETEAEVASDALLRA